MTEYNRLNKLGRIISFEIPVEIKLAFKRIYFTWKSMPLAYRILNPIQAIHSPAESFCQAERKDKQN